MPRSISVPLIGFNTYNKISCGIYPPSAIISLMLASSIGAKTLIPPIFPSIEPISKEACCGGCCCGDCIDCSCCADWCWFEFELGLMFWTCCWGRGINWENIFIAIWGLNCPGKVWGEMFWASEGCCCCCCCCTVWVGYLFWVSGLG